MTPKNRQSRGDTRNNDQGFTLVEVLVAMAVFSIILLTIFSAFRTFSTSVDQMNNQRRTTDASHPGLHAMLSDLDQLFLVPYPRYKRPQDQDDADPFRLEGSETPIDGRPFSQLSFTCVNPAPIGAVPANGVSRITYYVRRHGKRLDLHRADRGWPFDGLLSPCTDPVLIRGISSFSLTYAGGDRPEMATWNSDDTSFDYAFPTRIDIAVGLEGDSGKRMLRTAVVLPVRREAAK